MNSRNKKKMLIVDDIMLNRLILTDLFAEEYDIIEAGNGQEAVDAIHQYGNSLAVILLDIIMPVMDGFGVLEFMQKSGLIAEIPVILITGEHAEEKVLQCYAMGVADLVNKPFNPEIVERRVSNVVHLYSSKHELELVCKSKN